MSLSYQDKQSIDVLMKKPITLAEAKAALFANAQVITETENLPLQKALGRTAGQNLISQIDLPPFTNSAMDGYALVASKKNTYTCIGSSSAGHPFQGRLEQGECIRISTGAMLPEDADAVVAQEDVHAEGNQVVLNIHIQAGQHIRALGMDKKAGQLLLKQGQHLTAACIGLLASAGVEQVCTIRAIRVALLTTGDELTASGKPLAKGCIYESNLPMLVAMLDPAPCQIMTINCLPDDKKRIKDHLMQLVDSVDVIIASGGMSVGDADFIASIVREQGQLHFWRIALKPGMPFAYGSLGSAVFFGLPGNPVSTVITLTELVTPYLMQMSGRTPEPCIRFQAKLQKDLYKSTSRTEFCRGYLTSSAEGHNEVMPIAHQQSNRISSLVEANCYIILSAGETAKSKGDLVVVQPI